MGKALTGRDVILCSENNTMANMLTAAGQRFLIMM